MHWWTKNCGHYNIHCQHCICTRWWQWWARISTGTVMTKGQEPIPIGGQPALSHINTNYLIHALNDTLTALPLVLIMLLRVINSRWHRWWLTNTQVIHPWWLISVIKMVQLVQGRRNSIANALELRLSCTNPPNWYKYIRSHEVSTCILSIILL